MMSRRLALDTTAVPQRSGVHQVAYLASTKALDRSLARSRRRQPTRSPVIIFAARGAEMELISEEEV